MLRFLFLAIALVATLGSLACTSNKQQQATAEEQRRIQQEQPKAAEQQKTIDLGVRQVHARHPAEHRIRPEKGRAKKATATAAVSTEIAAAIAAAIKEIQA